MNENYDFEICEEPKPKIINDISALRALEIDCICDYLYYTLILSESFDRIKSELEEFSTDLIEHIKILGKIMIKYGGDPAIKLNISNKPSLLFAKTDCGDFSDMILRCALERESAIFSEYARLCSLLSFDIYTNQKLSNMANDIKYHKKIIKENIENIK